MEEAFTDRHGDVPGDRAGAGRRARGEQRRERIFRALHDCVIDKGYSKTTLADIAQRADMTPSHLLYYFPGKEAILEEYFAGVAEWIIERLHALDSASDAERIELLADLWFGGNAGNRKEIGFMLECFGEAVHDGRLRRIKADFDRRCKSHLRQLLAGTGSHATPASAEAAEIAFSLLTGLRNSVYFDDGVTATSARRTFCRTLNALRRSSAS